MKLSSLYRFSILDITFMEDSRDVSGSLRNIPQTATESCFLKYKRINFNWVKSLHKSKIIPALIKNIPVTPDVFAERLERLFVVFLV